MKTIILFIALLVLPITAQTPALELDIVIRTSGDAAATRTLCRRFAKTKGWTPKIRDAQGVEIDNPETPCNFAERHLETYVIQAIERDEVVIAREAAETTVKVRIPTEVVGKKTPAPTPAPAVRGIRR